jgi:periplasmic divalent cation tolerance protein
MTRSESADVLLVLTTAPDGEVAERIGTSLVEERLAACANVVPSVTSIYRWEGTLQREAEVLVLLKTTTDGVEALRDRLVELHPYDVPEIIALSVKAGHLPYLAWVDAEVDPRGRPEPPR